MICIKDIEKQLERIGFVKKVYISEPELVKFDFGETSIEVFYSTDKEAFDMTVANGDGLYEGVYDSLLADDEDAAYICACDIAYYCK